MQGLAPAFFKEEAARLYEQFLKKAEIIGG